MPSVEEIRADFPILDQKVNGKPLVYLDNAATTQKPRAVIRAITEYYEGYNANVHRSIHKLGEAATAAYEGAHEKFARFVGGRSLREVVFTKNSTEAINLVAHDLRRTLAPGDEIVVSLMEHHSNLVPWQQAAKATGAKLRILDVDADGRIDMDAAARVVGPKTRLLSVTGMSNVLGVMPDVRALGEIAHDRRARVVVDGAQLVPHHRVDVQRLGCDLLVASGHKMLGPTGIGMLWGTEEALHAMEPFLYGGEMISRVTIEESRWNELPWKFEAGTPAIAEAVGLSAAIGYLENVGMDWVERHEREITEYAMKRLSDVPGLRIFGPPAKDRGGVVAFEMEGIHAHDLASLLDQDGIAIRAGHHCAQPLMKYLQVASTARASFYIYTTREEIDALARSLMRARGVFGLG